jgi:hypothetical protein
LTIFVSYYLIREARLTIKASSQHELSISFFLGLKIQLFEQTTIKNLHDAAMLVVVVEMIVLVVDVDEMVVVVVVAVNVIVGDVKVLAVDVVDDVSVVVVVVNAALVLLVTEFIRNPKPTNKATKATRPTSMRIFFLFLLLLSKSILFELNSFNSIVSPGAILFDARIFILLN